MIDALDALKLMRTQGMRQPAARRVIAPVAQPLVNIFKTGPKAAPKLDQFQKALAQPEVTKFPKAVRGAIKPTLHPEAHQALLEKPAPSGGLGGLFQTLKTKWLAKVTPAPVQPALNPVQNLRQAMEANRMHVAETAPKPFAAGQNNPFRTMEALLLNDKTEAAGLREAAQSSRATNKLGQNANPNPASGIAAVTMPLAGVGLVASPLVGPAAIVMKPALMNPFVAKLPVIIP